MRPGVIIEELNDCSSETAATQEDHRFSIDQSNRIKTGVISIIETLVQHYQQPIHAQDLSSEWSVVEVTGDDDDHQDDGDGAVSSFLSIMIDKIFELHATTQEDEEELAEAAEIERVHNKNLMTSYQIWIQMVDLYTSHIRPTWIRSNQPTGSSNLPQFHLHGLAVLRHYQQFVFGYLQRSKFQITSYCSDASTNPDKKDFKEVLTKTMQLIAYDIDLATLCGPFQAGCTNESRNASKDEEGSQSRATSKLALPPLIRLLTDLWRLYGQQCRDINLSSSVSLDRRSFVTLLAFGPPSIQLLESESVSQAIHDSPLVQLQQQIETVSLVKIPSDPQGINAQISTSYRTSSLDWSILIDKIDGPFTTTGTPNSPLAKALQEYWQLWIDSQSTTTMRDSHASSLLSSSSWYRNILRLATSRWTILDLTKDVRAHFFGRDLPPDSMAIVKPVQTRLYLGKTVPYHPDPDVTEKPFVKIPSRVTVAWRFLALLASNGTSTSAESLPWEVLEELIPVCYELLSASSYSWNACGAAMVYKLIEIFFVTPHNNNNNNGPSESKLVLKPISQHRVRAQPHHHPCQTSLDNLLTMLTAVARTCREGPVLAIVAKTYSRVLTVLLQLNRHDKEQVTRYQSQRRSTTHQWITTLYQNQTSVHSQAQLILGLVLGIAQLLHDQAQQGRSADGVEAGRLGLAAILPLLLQCDDTDESYDILATPLSSSLQIDLEVSLLVALHNLMLAAYPIIPRHAGKILCHLLRVCARLDEDLAQDCDNDSNTKLDNSKTGRIAVEDRRRLALHVTSTALLLSGTKGDKLLEQLRQPIQGRYQERLIRIVESVEEDAKRRTDSS